MAKDNYACQLHGIVEKAQELFEKIRGCTEEEVSLAVYYEQLTAEREQVMEAELQK